MDEIRMMQEDLVFQKLRLDMMKELNSPAVLIENQIAIIAGIENNIANMEIVTETEL